MSGVTGNPLASSRPTERGPTGSRLAYLYSYWNPKVLFKKEFYTSGVKGGVLTFVSVLSVLALYSVIAGVSVLHTIKHLRGRQTPKSTTPPKTPLDFELDNKANTIKPVEEVGINMDDVLEIPGEEVEFAAMKEEMPAPDQIPEINDEPQVGSSDEQDAGQAIMSDDDSIHEGLVTLKQDIPRPLSPPATPPTAAFDAPVHIVESQSSPRPEIEAFDIPKNFGLEEQLAKADDISERAIEGAPRTVEEAVEEHAKIVENAVTPTESVDESSKPSALVEENKAASLDLPAAEVSTSEPEQLPVIEEPVPEIVAPKQVTPAKPEEPVVVVDEPEPLQAAPNPVEPIEEPKPVEEPKPAEEPKPVEAPKPIEAPKLETDSSKPARDDNVPPLSPKSLGRPRVMRRATGSTSAVAGVTTSPAPATVAVTATEDKPSGRERALHRANEALNMLAGSILRSNTSERLAGRSMSPPPSGIPRPVSPVPRSTSPVNFQRSGSPANFRRPESPSNEPGSRPSSPPPTSSRRGSIAGPRPSVSRQSTLSSTEQPVSRSPPKKFTNPPRGGAASPPPLPLPPQRQASLKIANSPQVPQAAVMSPSILSRKATIDSNGSPGSPPLSPRRSVSPGPRSPAEEFTTDSSSKRDLSFPPATNGHHPIVNTSILRPRPRPRTSTGSSATSPTAPNTLQASLLATLGAKVNFPSPGSKSTSSSAGSGPTSPASPRSDSIASAVSNRDSIFSYSDMSDMDMSASDLDFTGRESDRMVLGARYDSVGSMSSDGEMSGNEEEKRKKRAKRRAKARAQTIKKQKRAKRN